ncbi:hypothetical protein J2848_007100 [Azospirillum lipoferum]|uniref:Sugar O-methyltransferase n=1 Tax=Azospirillum lipoferum TaxID=193 RepID=A0A5A9FVW3_AZOLI|nr:MULTISPECIES: hypothetical protein [Azospirillum]KAA0586236.1 hypothetical protein FZ942_34880 [Azospirillum lipoferum]MCP1615387.1 hypothetical protein [Azospirillum lipoferum]MDW5536983.1 hypothetical protein [Azospirillum sp. NL1]
MEANHAPQPQNDYQVFLKAFLEKISEVSGRSDRTAHMPIWEKFSLDLYELSKSRDMRQFLHFQPIIQSMVIGESDYIQGEFSYLRNLKNWEERWAPALKENIFGMPIPSVLHPSSSNNLIHHAYHAAKFEAATGSRFEDMDIMVEFGGGYGSFCRLARNLGFRGRYIIFDLPAFSALQQFFLQSIGLTATDRLDELEDGVTLCCSDLAALKPFVLEQLAQAVGRSAFVATWSLSESPQSVRDDFEPILRKFSHFLIAYQGRFFDIDNTQYFRYVESITDGISWKTEPTVNSDNFYKFGGRAPA